MRLAIVTCVYKRHRLAEVVLGTYRRLQAALANVAAIDLLAVGSEGATSRRLCEDAGFDYVEFPNSPLSRKWNEAVRQARRYDPDAVVIVGSDDVISPALLRSYCTELRRGHLLFGVRDLHFFDVRSARLGYWPGYQTIDSARVGDPIGFGRCIARPILQRTGWNLWPSELRLDRDLSPPALDFLRGFGFEPMSWRLADLGAEAVDIKSDFNIKRFEEFHFSSLLEAELAKDYMRRIVTASELDEILALGDAGRRA